MTTMTTAPDLHARMTADLTVVGRNVERLPAGQCESVARYLASAASVFDETPAVVALLESVAALVRHAGTPEVAPVKPRVTSAGNNPFTKKAVLSTT